MPEAQTTDHATMAGEDGKMPTPPPPEGYWTGVWRRYRRHRSGMVGLVVLSLLALVAFLSPLLANDKPIACNYEGETFFPAVVETFHQIPLAEHVYSMPKPFRFPTFNAKQSVTETTSDWAVWPPIPFGPNEANPMIKLEAPSSTHLLGTDEVGRDVMGRMIYGSEIAIQIGFVSMGIASFIGLILGAAAGYHGGWVDIVISRVIEVFICVPLFYVILIVLQITEPDIKNVMIVIGLFSWTAIARYARAEMMKLRSLDYAVAARALGVSTPRIIFRHLMPNALAPVLVVIAFGIAGAIFTETGLSWLGFGVQPPAPTWGNILRSGWDNLRVAPHLIFPASVAVFVAVLALNLIGDALRDVTDPRLVSSAS